MKIENNKASSVRLVLYSDGIVGLTFGLLLLLAGSFLESLTGLPETFLTIAGVIVLPVGAYMIFTGTVTPRISWIMGIVLVNIAWIAGSAMLFFLGLPLTTFGYLFVASQALVVALFTTLEWREIQKLRNTALAGT